MKTLIALLLLSFVLPVMAADVGSKTDSDRYVADDIEIETLPNGEVVTRLVSKSKLTVRKFWTNSYSPQGFILVFQGQGRTPQNVSDNHNGQKNEWQIFQDYRASNDLPDFLVQAVECK